jgi:hypothetical protein
MSELMLCLSCERHLRLAETRCPFCGAEVTDAARRPVTAADVPKGASRGAGYAARVALLAGGAVLACSGNGGPGPGDGATDGTVADASGTGGAAAGSGGGGGAAAGSGGGGGATAGSGGGGGLVAGTGGRVGGSGGLATPYGCVWPPDAAVEV